MKQTILTLSAVISFLLISCSTAFQPIDFGKDACAHCKMNIVDARFAAELLTSKGKAFKFDDMACLKKYIDENKLSKSGFEVFVADYQNSAASFLDARKAVYLQSESFNSPMNGNYAAFASEENASTIRDSLDVKFLNWENVN